MAKICNHQAAEMSIRNMKFGLALGLALAKARSEPRAHSPSVHSVPSDALFSRLPAFEEEDFS